MAIFRVTMTALVLAGFAAATLPAAAQDVRRHGKAAHATHAKKRTAGAQQTRPAAARGMGNSESWMDHGSTSGAGGGGY
jgi:hypothetical protein